MLGRPQGDYGLKAIASLRRSATVLTFALTAAVLAGCNAEYQSNLDPSASAGFAGNPAAPSPVASAGAAQPSGASEPGQTVAMAGEDTPLPAPRPDFGDRKELAIAIEVAPETSPAPQVAAAKPEAGTAAPAADAKTNVAAREEAPEEDPEPPLTPGAEGIAKRSFNAYEDKIASAAEGRPEPEAAGAGRTAAATSKTLSQTAAGGAVVTTTAYAPAVAEVNGANSNVRIASVRSYAPLRPTHASLRSIPASGGATGGAGWTAAYDHVVTRCFDATLRRALTTIARHFNSQVEVTSGYRTNGRRRSMHRFCRAADIRVVGVRPSAVARFARTLPGINGVGTYRRKSIVHIDTRLQQMTWRY